MKIKTLLVCIILGILVCSTAGVFATWSYGYNDIQEKETTLDLHINQFKYFDEVVITKITPVLSTAVSEYSTYTQPTEVNSVITGSSGQKIVYKVNARNYSKTNYFVYAGADYNSNVYQNLNKLSISVSIDEQGANLINSNISDNAHRGPSIAPGEEFVFYITYTLTGKISAGEILVDYTFKPIIYTVTYLHNNQRFAVEHITNNQTVYNVISNKPTQSGASFAGWVNVNGVVINTIPKYNENNYTLTASWDKVYIIIFADAKGNMLYQEQFTSSSTALSSQGQATVDQILADLNAEASKEDMKVSWSEYTIKGAKEDIMVKAIYAYDGILNLVPVYEQPDDGIVDYYRVEAVDTLPKEITIPGSVGGVPVTTVVRVANTEGENDWNNYADKVETIIVGEGVERLEWNSLAWTPKLTTVKLPSTITYLAKNTFSRNDVFGNDKKTLTIEFNGTKAQWKAILNNSDKNWDGGLKEGTIVQCTDGSFKLEKPNWLSSLRWVEY